MQETEIKAQEHCSGLLSIAMTKHSDQKQPGEGKVDLARTSKSRPIAEKVREETQEEQVGGTENEATEECCLLTCFPWLLHTRDHLPSVPQCTGPSHINH